MPQDKKVTWAIAHFSETIKNRFMGIAKMQGKATAPLLENIVKRYVYEVEQEKRGNKA